MILSSRDGWPDAFTTARLVARRLREADAAELLRMHRDEAVMAHLGGLRDEGETAQYLERNLRHWVQYNFGLWIVYERGGAEPIGRALLRHLDVEGRDEIEVGYAFYQPWWGRGYATETATACLEHARGILGCETVVAVTNQDNHGSQHVLRKCGLVFDRHFQLEGATRCLYRVRWGGPVDASPGG